VPLIYKDSRVTTSPPPTVNTTDFNTKASTSCFIKYTNEVTLLLSGQKLGTSSPAYHNGDVLEGTVTLHRPSRLASIDVRVYGVIRIKEIAGAGAMETMVLQETICRQDNRQDVLSPRIPIRYRFPDHYIDEWSGERYPLPPTYATHLSGIPGFTTHVSYHIVVDVTRLERKALSWRRTSRIDVPLLLRQHTRPSHSPPFRLNPAKSLTGPQTLFTFSMEALNPGRTHIETHVYLPSSQVCSLQEPIPFFVTLFGNDDSLAPFTSFRPSPASFHPLSSSSNASLTSVQQQLGSRPATCISPLRIHLQRTTIVDVLRADVSASPHSHIYSSKVIGQGVVHNTSKGHNSITWSGTISIATGDTNGGFVTKGLCVSDHIVISIRPPELSRLHFAPFRETIRLHLTTQSHDCLSATPVSVTDV